MKKAFFILGFTFLFTLTGCSLLKKTKDSDKNQDFYYSLTKRQIEKAEQKKLPKDYKTLVKQNFDLTIESPNAIKYVFFKPVRAYNPLTSIVFWLVKVDVSEKNWLGNYASYQSYLFSSNGRGKLVDITMLLKTSAIVIIDKFEKDE